MRLDTQQDRTKVWLTETEVEQLLRKAREKSDEHEIAISLMCRCGLRSHEVPQVTPQDTKRTEDGDHHLLRVRAGKDTTGGNGKARDTWLPEEVESIIYRYSRDKQPTDPIVNKSKRTVQRWVSSLSDELADETGNPDWKHVTSHDLRRHWANKLLVEERINPRVVMSLGGWNDYQGIKPYLNSPTESVIVDEMQAVEI